MDQLSQALDKISYDWLTDEHPELVTAVEMAVGRGMKPEAVGRFVRQHAHRRELALRCEQAARHIVNMMAEA